MERVISMASVGKHIKRLRTARHLTQEDLAEKLFVTWQALSAWETGKALLGGNIAIILAVIYIILHNYGFAGTWRYGLRYQFWNRNYAVTLEEFPNVYSLELNLTDLESNTGKVPYEDDSGCRFTVKSMEETTSPGGYKRVFPAEEWAGMRLSPSRSPG